LEEHEALMNQRLLGCALVITSPLLRMALSIVFHLRSMPTPYVVVADVATGARWAAGRLEDAGLAEAAAHVRHHFSPLPDEAPR
jgi:hypothetical protein